MPRFNIKEKYEKTVVPGMQKKYGYKNVMDIPRVEKIVINRGLGEATGAPKVIDIATAELAAICGQKPAVTKSKKSIAAFKVREGVAIGCKVTLRGARMYLFLNKLINVALPRIRDFRGVSVRAFDGHGNYTLGLAEQLIFPEVDYDKVDKIRGMDITIVTSAKTNDEAREMLTLFGMPFRKETKAKGTAAVEKNKGGETE